MSSGVWLVTGSANGLGRNIAEAVLAPAVLPDINHKLREQFLVSVSS